MNQYVTGSVIKRLREAKAMTQSDLANKIGVSDKAVSKWETGKGLPDITLLEPLADALGISTIELLSGNEIVNSNRASNMLRVPFYVCPVCGNVIHSIGQAVISCCGITLPPLEAEDADPDHQVNFAHVEDEWYVTIDHPMTKDHYISFVAAVADNGLQIVKLYPEGEAGAYFKTSRCRWLYYYCNKHGLFKVRAPKRR